MNLHGVNEVRQSEKHKAEPVVLELAPFEFEVATGRLKTHKLFDSDRITAELFQACLGIFLSKIH